MINKDIFNPAGIDFRFQHSRCQPCVGESAGLPFSGRFDFVETTYVFPITHMVAPKEKTLACTECHNGQDSRLANLGGFYMPGRDRSQWLDILGWITVLGSLAGVVLHGVGRFFANGKNSVK